MKMTRIALCAGTAMVLAGCAPAYESASTAASEPAPVANATPAATEAPAIALTQPPARDPSQLQVLFWSDEQRSARFRDMENWFAGHEVPAAQTTRDLPAGEPLSDELQGEIKEMMAATNVAGLMVLQDGKVRFEDYGLGLGKADRWTSFSVAKSFTSTLLGAALADGLIGSLEDPIIQYIPELEGSSYDLVTVGQLATMTSGVAWNEDYTDPASDVAQLNRYVVEYGPNAIVEQMKRLGRANEPGEKFAYSTGETNLIGLLIENAIGMPMAEYAQSKIVEPAGFEGGLFWMVDPRGGNIGGCCLSLRLSDYARMGQFALEGGMGVSGTQTVPEGWFAKAGAEQVSFGGNGFGYGYQWWTYPGGNYGAQGIFGQAITIVPEANLVVASVSNWPTATSGPNNEMKLRLTYKIAASGK